MRLARRSLPESDRKLNSRPPSEVPAVEGLACTFLDRIHHQQQVCIESTPHLLPLFAGPISRFLYADATYAAADRTDILADIMAVHGPDRIHHLGQQPEQRAIGRLFAPAVAFNRAVRADSANSFLKDCLQFR